MIILQSLSFARIVASTLCTFPIMHTEKYIHIVKLVEKMFLSTYAAGRGDIRQRSGFHRMIFLHHRALKRSVCQLIGNTLKLCSMTKPLNDFLRSESSVCRLTAHELDFCSIVGVPPTENKGTTSFLHQSRQSALGRRIRAGLYIS